MAYEPGVAPASYDGEFLRRELQKIREAMAAPVPFDYLEQLHVEPAKPREGMVVLADGADWNPGYGPGFYGFTQGKWVPITTPSSGMDAGQIAWFAGLTVAPIGYVEANGAALSRIAYARLFSVIGTTFGAGDGSTTFNVPDFRGVFARGWDHGRGIDPGRAAGSFQEDAFQGHYHIPVNNSAGGSTPVNLIDTSVGNVGGAAQSPLIGTSVGSPASDGVHGVPRLAAETRPYNVALLVVIKY